MSAPRPGHVSRGGERRRRPPGSAPARPALPPGRPGPSPGPAPLPRCAALLRPGPARGKTTRPGVHRGGGTTPPGVHRGGGRPQLPACTAAPVRREAAALAEGVPPSAGRSTPRRPLPPPWALPRRTPGGGRRSVAAGFKSPIPSPKSCQPNDAKEEALRYEIEELKQKDLALDQEIAQLLSEGYSLEELEKHISLLHEYNDIKDAGQMLLGKLAVIRGVTTKQLYPEYDLELSD
ncbi:DNA repair protein SWI5 homolog [Nyctibius grandis]